MVTPDPMFADRLFYSLAALVTFAMIWFALSFGGSESVTDAEIIAEGWDLSGPDLAELTISPGSEGVFIDDEGGFIRLSQFTPSGQGPQSIGVFATLGPGHERAFAGRLLRITIRARASRNNPLESFDSGYFTMEGRPSGWSTFQLGSDWQDYRFKYRPPIIDAPANVDLIAVFPGRAGERQQMDIAAFQVDVLDKT